MEDSIHACGSYEALVRHLDELAKLEPLSRTAFQAPFPAREWHIICTSF